MIGYYGLQNNEWLKGLFDEQYDKALRDKMENERLADFRSFNATIACLSHYGFESQFQNAFTNAKFKEFQVEIAAIYDVLQYFI
jgi:hypothetical protein